MSGFRWLVFLVIIGLFQSCENDRGQVNDLTKKAVGTEEATDIRITYTLGGKTKSILTAPLMLHVQDSTSYYEFPKTVYAEFYNDQAQKETYLTALYAKYKDNESIIYLRDSVKIINQLKGDTIYCKDLWWDRSRKDREFYTDDSVRIRQRDGNYLDGTGMEASQNFKNYTMLHPRGVQSVKGDVLPSPK